MKQATLVVDSSSKSDEEEYDLEDSGSSGSNSDQSEGLSQNTNIKLEQFDSFSRQKSNADAQYNDETKLKLMFLRKIKERQIEMNTAHFQKETVKLQKEHHYISSQVTQWEDYVKQVSFKMSL